MQIKSRLLKQLDQQIAAAAAQPVLAACLKAKRAMLLARHGALAEAREQLTALHQLAFQHPHPEIGAWLHFAEGLMSYYTDFSSSTREKIQRAYAIAKSAGLSEIIALASAWLAQLAYVRHELPLMLELVRECQQASAPEHHVARARACMSMGLAWHYAGDTGEAQRWYERARSHALAEGDDASLSSLMFNMQAMRTAQSRRAVLSGRAEPNAELLLGLDSVHHYDAAVSSRSLPNLTPVQRAQILVLQGQFEAARALYEEHLPLAMSRGLARLGSSLLADMAWCRVNCGQSEQALQQAREAEIELDPTCDVDDRAATHSRLCQIYEALGDGGAAQRHRDLAVQEWAEFARQQSDWLMQLRDAALQPF
ncbi:hypothetical protein RQP53_10205 [Paucibacter sp. APW11]|uniref:MalT-like TPR region domain-containing protein n=1 Tax=Roseateles aquae TaxID=3077235 RepID=A0ABU3PBG3_9BURK|nr:hypothetical protein [Paucibacter sp. APW11]MDT8999637.1 hypothetical protein [Paucibacter sp. APW11]